MPKNGRNAKQRAFHLQEVARLYLQEKRSQGEIAEALGVTQQQVSYDLKTLQRQWRESSTRAISEAQAEEIARIDALERTYWEAWAQSRIPIETTYTEQLREPGTAKDRKTDKDAKTADQEADTTANHDKTGKQLPENDADQMGKLVKSRAWMRRQGSYGDPRFLEGVRWCISKRAEILGLNGPMTDDKERDATTRITDDQRAGAVAQLIGRLRDRVPAAPAGPERSVAPTGGATDGGPSFGG